MKVKANLLCVAGAAIGITSLFLPTFIVGTADNEESILSDILTNADQYPTGFLLGITMFLLGIGLAFLTPTAGFLQLTGLMTFLYMTPETYPGKNGFETTYGLYVSIVGTALVSFSLFLPKGLGYPTARKFWHQLFGPACRLLTFCPYDADAKLRVNLLCVLGAFLAFLGLALPWLVSTTTWYAGDLTEQTTISLYSYVGGSTMEIAALVFLAGSVIAFLTPVSSLVQFIGLFWMYAVISPKLFETSSAGGRQTVELGWGFYLGLTSIILVALSFFIPLGVGYLGRKSGIKGHLWVWGVPGETRGISTNSLVHRRATKSFK